MKNRNRKNRLRNPVPPIVGKAAIAVPTDSNHVPDVKWYTEHLALSVSTAKWVLLGAITGLLVGLGTRIFLWSLNTADHIVLRLSNYGIQPYWFLPFALVTSVWLVQTFAPDAKGHGTEAVIEAVHERNGQVDAKVAPVKLLATVLTLAFGGSVGKEGPCAQIGAAITSTLAGWLRVSPEDRRRLVICGIGAGFAAVFGTPVSGALFGIEVLYLGRIEYGVLFPCLVAGIVSHLVCGTVAPAPTHVASAFAGIATLQLISLSVLFGALCGLTALLLIKSSENLGKWLHRFETQPYAVAFLGGTALVVIFQIFGPTYDGLGLPLIDQALAGTGHILIYAFLIKIVVTAITLEVGGSGGIITPLFFIGATLGTTFAQIFHLPNQLFASFGFIAVVAAATNTPIALSVMAMELMPGDVGVYAALAACTAYLMVGHHSVYSSQRLGILKSAALEMLQLDTPIGKFKGTSMKIRPGSLTERLHRLNRRDIYRANRSGTSKKL